MPTAWLEVEGLAVDHSGAVYVADSAAVQMARMTPREAHLLLRAWLSPIPPPPLERLSDLE